MARRTRMVVVPSALIMIETPRLPTVSLIS